MVGVGVAMGARFGTFFLTLSWLVGISLATSSRVFSWILPTADLPTCTDFRGTYRFWPSITISRFHAVVYRFWKMREFLGLADFVLFCFRRYSVDF